jgi:hypothetical protein
MVLRLEADGLVFLVFCCLSAQKLSRLMVLRLLDLMVWFCLCSVAFLKKNLAG